MDDAALAAAIDDLILELTATGVEVGLQVVVIRDGDTVVDAAVGVADPGAGTPVTADTLFWAASTAKGVTSSVAHVLVEQGQLRYDLPLADVWPEFGAHGKGGVTLRHVLDHTAGVPGLPLDTTAADLCDWDRICSVIAASEPWWAPGTRFGYHAKTFGFLVGEVVRRATGAPISTILRECVTGPLGIVDEVHFGVPSDQLGRVARQIPVDGAGAEGPEPGSPLERALPPGVVPDAAYANRPDVLTSDIPSEGTMTARGVARLYAGLLGHVDGVELVSAARLEAMAALTFVGMDEVMGFPSSWAFGYSPSRPNGGGEDGSTFGMTGMNGSVAYADIATGLAVAVMRNRFTSGDASTVARIDQLIAEHRPTG